MVALRELAPWRLDERHMGSFLGLLVSSLKPSWLFLSDDWNRRDGNLWLATSTQSPETLSDGMKIDVAFP